MAQFYSVTRVTICYPILCDSQIKVNLHLHQFGLFATMDGFDEMDDDAWSVLTIDFKNTTTKPEKTFYQKNVGSAIVRRLWSGIHTGISRFHISRDLMIHILVRAYGKASLQKTPITLDALTATERMVYYYIKQYFNSPEAVTRVSKMMHDSQVSKRTINYFIVHYSADNHVHYYIDQKTKAIVGDINCDTTPVSSNPLVYINLHAEYKAAKKHRGSNNLHSPYARSVTVKPLTEYSLCEYNFWIWVDSIGAYNAFKYVEPAVRKAKYIFDKHTRNQTGKKRKKPIQNSNIMMNIPSHPPKF